MKINSNKLICLVILIAAFALAGIPQLANSAENVVNNVADAANATSTSANTKHKMDAKSAIKLKAEKILTKKTKEQPKEKKKKVSTKPTSTDKLMDETVKNSLIKEEYNSGEEIKTTEANKKDKPDFVIEGSVQKNLEMDLGDCLKLALGNNPRIRSALNTALAAHAQIGEAWSNYFPRLNWQTGVSKTKELQALEDGDSRTYKSYLMGDVALSQMLYDFGVTQNLVTIKKLGYQSYKTSLTGVVNDVIYQVKDSYYNLLLAYENEKVAKDTVKKYEMFYNQAKAFYEIGTNPKVDVLIAEVNLSDAKLKLIQAENSIDAAISQLNNAMGVPEIGKYTVKERLRFSPVKITFDGALELAKQARPELKMAELRVQQANQEVKLAKKAFLPSIDASAGYRRGGYAWNGSDGYNLGVYLNFPTVNGMLINNQIKEAKALYDKEIAEAQITKNDIHLEIHEAYLQLDVKKNQIPVALAQVKQAKENYDLSYGRYRVGVGNPIELKDAQNYYQAAQLNYYKSLYEYNSAKSLMEKSIGKNIIGDVYDHIDLEK